LKLEGWLRDDERRKLDVAAATILTPLPRPERKQHAKPTWRIENKGMGMPFFVTAIVAAVLVWLVGVPVYAFWN
jgi:hypothetical protein